MKIFRNLCRAITGKIGILKIPEEFRSELKKYYALQIIGLGNDKNYVAENDRSDKIPAGGKAVIVGEIAGQEGIRIEN